VGVIHLFQNLLESSIMKGLSLGGFVCVPVCKELFFNKAYKLLYWSDENIRGMFQKETNLRRAD
jgi:hypothetical protein